MPWYLILIFITVFLSVAYFFHVLVLETIHFHYPPQPNPDEETLTISSLETHADAVCQKAYHQSVPPADEQILPHPAYDTPHSYQGTNG